MHVISRWIKDGVIAVGIALALCAKGFPYTVITVAGTAPQGLEQELIANTTTQYQATLLVNPFFAGTYQINISGLNPNFNSSPTNQQLLDYLVTVDSWTYVAGWANGESYQQSVDTKIADDFTAWCSSAPYFGLVSIDSTTCLAVAGGLAAEIVQMHLSAPTVVPGDFQ
jgi:hypothetical protein